MKVLALSVIFFFALKIFAQPTLSGVVCKAKLTEKERLVTLINNTIKLPIADSTYIQYQSTFWAMMLLEYKPRAALPKIKYALQNFHKWDVEFQNALLEVVYSQYPKELEKEILVLIKNESITVKQFAVCGEYLLKTSHKNKKIIDKATDVRKRKLVFGEKNFYLFALESKKSFLEYKYKEIIDDLQNNRLLTNKNLVVSFQNRKREYAGLALVRDSLGKFISINDTIFYTQQLTRSITNLPYYISNGNTPQGIYRINGFGNSKNNHIGPTDNFQLCMPFECNVKDFFDEEIIDSTWSFEMYFTLLKNQPIQNAATQLLESAIAGKLGRFEIIAHGTTVNNEYYKGKSYYGFTPTMGCLQAKEIWDYATGKRIYSDQQKLVDAYKSIGAEKGYLTVLDIIDANRPVTINDVKKLLQQ